MDENQLNKIKKRVEESPSLPWTIQDGWDDEGNGKYFPSLRFADGKSELIINESPGQTKEEIMALAKFLCYSKEDILALIAENTQLRKALRDIAHGPVGTWNLPEHREEVIRHLMQIAEDALKESAK